MNTQQENEELVDYESDPAHDEELHERRGQVKPLRQLPGRAHQAAFVLADQFRLHQCFDRSCKFHYTQRRSPACRLSMTVDAAQALSVAGLRANPKRKVGIQPSLLMPLRLQPARGAGDVTRRCRAKPHVEGDLRPIGNPSPSC